MIDVLKRNKLLVLILGLSLIVTIVLFLFIFSGKNSTKVPLRGVFVNESNLLQKQKEGVGA